MTPSWSVRGPGSHVLAADRTLLAEVVGDGWVASVDHSRRHAGGRLARPGSLRNTAYQATTAIVNQHLAALQALFAGVTRQRRTDDQ